MQTVKSEWASLQAQFTSLSLGDRLSRIIDELKTLKHEIVTQHPEPVSNLPDSLELMLRKIQRYIEWTVPALVPDRAEEAETLVNISRFAARLLIQKKAWNTGDMKTDLEHQIQEISAIQHIA